jgi:hypothetical protein
MSICSIIVLHISAGFQADVPLLSVSNLLRLCSLNLQGFKPLMSAHRVQDLARMYSLLSRVGGTDALRDEWRQYITTTGTAIVKDEANVSRGISRYAAVALYVGVSPAHCWWKEAEPCMLRCIPCGCPLCVSIMLWHMLLASCACAASSAVVNSPAVGT